MLSKLQFWTIVAGLVAFVVRFFQPDFPLDETQILAFIVFLLGLFGVIPQAASQAVGLVDLLKSRALWILVAGAVSYVVHYYLPEFPMDEAAILALILYVLGAFGINPEMRARGLMK